jgi:hypothetical protein
LFIKKHSLHAPDVPRPDKIGMMQEMAKMDMRMGAHALKFRPGREEPYKMREKWGMQMDDHDMDMEEEDDHMDMDEENDHHMDMEEHDHIKSISTVIL